MTAQTLPAKAALSRQAGDGGLEQRMSTLETRLDTILPTLATKGDLESVKSEIHKSSSDTHRWMIGTAIGLFFGFGALFLATSNSLKAAPASPQPIVINVPVPLGAAQAASALVSGSEK